MLELYHTFLGYIFIMILGYKTWKDLFKPKISYDAPARECRPKGYQILAAKF